MKCVSRRTKATFENSLLSSQSGGCTVYASWCVCLCMCVHAPYLTQYGACFYSGPVFSLWAIFMLFTCLILKLLFHLGLIVQNAGSQMFPGHSFIKYTFISGALGMTASISIVHSLDRHHTSIKIGLRLHSQPWATSQTVTHPLHQSYTENSISFPVS